MAVESLWTLAGVHVVSLAFQRIFRVARVCVSATIATVKEYCCQSKQPVWMLCADCCISLEPHSNSRNEGKLIKELRACVLFVFNFFFFVSVAHFSHHNLPTVFNSTWWFRITGNLSASWLWLFWMCPHAPLITTSYTRHTLTVCLLQCFFLLIQVVHSLLLHSVLCGGTKSSFLFYFFSPTIQSHHRSLVLMTLKCVWIFSKVQI